jgi:hypothetical protein
MYGKKKSYSDKKKKMTLSELDGGGCSKTIG